MNPLTPIVTASPASVDVPDSPPAWIPSFPSPQLVRTAAALLDPLPAWKGEEGPRYRIRVSPGSIAVRSVDLARRERTHERTQRGESLLASDQLEVLPDVLDLRLERAHADEARHLEEAHRAVSAYAQRETWRRVSLDAARIDDLEALKRVRDRDAQQLGGLSVVTEWSAKSRARMVQTLAELDYSPLFSGGGVPAMMTLTYPGDWESVAPDAATCKRHVDALKRRFLRDWGTKLVGPWKREWQRRGAPHYHVLITPPAGRRNGRDFASWLSRAWAAVVGSTSCGEIVPTFAPGPNGRPLIVCCERHRHEVAGTGLDYAEGMRAKDPKRLAIYFAKHGAYAAKEYQNQAPQAWRDAGGSVGRFWGVWGLESAALDVEVTPEVALAAARTLRRWQSANGYRVQRTVWRKRYRLTLDETTGELVQSWSWRKRRSGSWSGSRMRGHRGFVVVNDGAAWLSSVSRYLDQIGNVSSA